MQKRVCVQVYPSFIKLESRITKTCASLSQSGLFDEVHFIGVTRNPEEVGEMNHPLGFKCTHYLRRSGIGASVMQKLTATAAFHAQVASRLRELSPSVIGCRSISLLRLAIAAKRQSLCSLMYDVHELETETLGSKGIRRILGKRVERAGIKQCDGVIVVNDSIADWYRDEYGICRPDVVKAFPDLSWQQISTNQQIFRERYNIPENEIVFLYQGLLSQGRRITQLLDVFDRTKEGRHLVLMGYGQLQEAVEERARANPRIHFHPAVPPADLLSYTASADIGIAGVENRCLSYYLSLPNKLLEYLNAGIGILAPDFPEMSRVVREAGCGLVHPEDTEGLVDMIDGVTWEKVQAWKAAAAASRGKFVWASEAEKLVSAYRSLVAS